MRHTNFVATLLLACFLIAAQPQTLTTTVQAQDILRQRQQQPQTQQQQQQQFQNDPLANIQLPPQLASLSPEQLHHLAALRELQLQQQAAQRDQQQQQQQQVGSSATAAPSVVSTTNQPTNSVNAQIPQPNPASQSVDSNTNRHDDGSYNEAEMAEMEGAGNEQQSGGNSQAGNGVSNSQVPPTFEVNWNKCPQLEPNEGEKNKKTQVITGCLQSAPIPTNLTRENVEAHREQIATCALKAEGWFDEKGSYKYDKAESEIRAKKLDAPIELQVLKFHVACKEEASKKFPREQNKLIDQVQFYQACMDYYISIVCEIEVSVDQ